MVFVARALILGFYVAMILNEGAKGNGYMWFVLWDAKAGEDSNFSESSAVHPSTYISQKKPCIDLL